MIAHTRAPLPVAAALAATGSPLTADISIAGSIGVICAALFLLALLAQARRPRPTAAGQVQIAACSMLTVLLAVRWVDRGLLTRLHPRIRLWVKAALWALGISTLLAIDVGWLP